MNPRGSNLSKFHSAIRILDNFIQWSTNSLAPFNLTKHFRQNGTRSAVMYRSLSVVRATALQSILGDKEMRLKSVFIALLVLSYVVLRGSLAEDVGGDTGGGTDSY